VHGCGAPYLADAAGTTKGPGIAARAGTPICLGHIGNCLPFAYVHQSFVCQLTWSRAFLYTVTYGILTLVKGK